MSKHTRRGPGFQANYGVATWHVSSPNAKKYGKHSTMKNMREWLVGEAYIAAEDWEKLVAGEVVPNLDDPNYVYGLAWARDKFYPAFY